MLSELLLKIRGYQMPTVRIFDFICEVSYLMFDTKLKNICET